ncbi:hypothetical protein BGZ57DRAFT_993082 [Hyaloscypha finlandica]|nr:hypothetical protein BGZ57DRAFT_993082 [Hyaloscypha finlandica]
MDIDIENSISYPQETYSSTTSVSRGGWMDRSPISSTLMPIIKDRSALKAESFEANADLFDPYFLWTDTPRTDITSLYIDNSLQPRSKSLGDASVTSPSAALFGRTDFACFSNSAPGLSPPPNIYTSTSMTQTPTCSCFNSCIKTLQALHNSNAITPTSTFNVILNINQKAVEICSIMFNCSICMSESGSSSGTMLLGAIIGRIISTYQDASKNYFGLCLGESSQTQPLPLTFGTYRVTSEDVRWLEMRIILRDLEKLKEFLAEFREIRAKTQSEEDARMRGAITNYLCQSLNLTFEGLQRQNHLSYEQIDCTVGV